MMIAEHNDTIESVKENDKGIAEKGITELD